MPKNRIRNLINRLEVDNEGKGVSESVREGMFARGMEKNRFYQIRANLRQPNTTELLQFLEELKVFKPDLTLEELLDTGAATPGSITDKHNLVK